MNPDDLVYQKLYIVEVFDNNHLSVYQGKFSVYDSHEKINKYIYMFLVKDLLHTFTEEEVKHKVRPVPFTYRAMFGGIGGFRRWLINIIKLKRK